MSAAKRETLSTIRCPIKKRHPMNVYLLPLLVLGGMAAGFINTLAGGGSMLTLPLLILLGLPADVANGTNRVGVIVQNITGVLGFRSKGVKQGKLSLWLCLPAGIGAVAGAGVAVTVAPEMLERIFGVVLVFLCATVLLRPSSWLKGRDPDALNRGISIKTFLVFLVVGFWGGFAQVGVGFLFLGGLVLSADLDLVTANAVKIFVILVFTVFSFLVFLANGQIEFAAGLVMAVGHAIGAWFASVTSVKKGAAWVRVFLVAAALLASMELLGVFDLIFSLFRG